MKIKSNLFLIALIMISLQSTAQKAAITGDIKGLDVNELVFNYLVGDSSKSDTVKVKNGKFKWNAKLSEPEKIYIFFPNRYFQFYAENSNIKITGHADSISDLKVSGSKIQDEADAYNASLKDIEDQQMPLYQKYGKVSKEEQLKIEEKLDDLRKQRRARTEQYIANHPNSTFSASLVEDRGAMGEYVDVKAAFDLLSPTAKQSVIGQRVAKRLEVLKRSSVGEEVLNFTQNDTEGKPVTFNEFKGKYVLIDFWASWCGPCRAENPNVLKAYNNYKDKGFTVLGVSLDENGDNWKKAIADDGMPWTQVSDLKGWKNEVSDYYGIRGIPSTLLVGPDGKIIAKDLRGEILNKKLSELFD